MEMVTFGLQTRVTRNKYAVYPMSKFCVIQDATSTDCTSFLQTFRGCRASQVWANEGSEHVLVTSS